VAQFVLINEAKSPKNDVRQLSSYVELHQRKGSPFSTGGSHVSPNHLREGKKKNRKTARLRTEALSHIAEKARQNQKGVRTPPQEGVSEKITGGGEMKQAKNKSERGDEAPVGSFGRSSRRASQNSPRHGDKREKIEEMRERPARNNRTLSETAAKGSPTKGTDETYFLHEGMGGRKKKTTNEPPQKSEPAFRNQYCRRTAKSYSNLRGRIKQSEAGGRRARRMEHSFRCGQMDSRGTRKGQQPGEGKADVEERRNKTNTSTKVGVIRTEFSSNPLYMNKALRS